ncbi:hypothetical protein [Methanolobus profundi]|nr:hypothetical protein [Methanolobus profundi]
MRDNDNFFSKNDRIQLLLLVFFVIMLLTTSIGSAASIQKFSIDGRTYSPGDTITITGEILDGNSSGDVEITIWPEGDEFTGNDTANKTITANQGSFSTTMTAPEEADDYTIIAVESETGAISPYLHMDVVGMNDTQNIKVLFTEGDIINIPLSESHEITGNLNQSKSGGSVLLGSTTYYFLVSGQNIAYVDDDSEMDITSDNSGMAVIGNLEEGAKVKLNDITYRLIHINYYNGITLARTIAPTFAGGETVNVTVMTLNATGYPVQDTIGIEYLRENGTAVTTTEVMTDANGINTTEFEIQSTGGTYHLVAEDIGHISFVVNTMTMFGDVLSTENLPKHTFARGEVMVPVVYLNNLSSGSPMDDATVTATITSKENGSYLNELDLAYDSSIGAYITNYTIPGSAETDTYYIEYEASSGSQTQKAYTYYNIKAYDLFLKVASKNKGESDGFAPGEEAFLIIAGTDLSTGESLDLEATTGLDTANFLLNITDSTGDDHTTSWSLMNATSFYQYLEVPTDIQDEIEQDLGDSFTIINFTAPAENGVYDTILKVNISGWNTARRSITVQDLFVHGEPVNKMGWFSPTVAPNSTARIMITAFDPSTGAEIPASDIHEAGLIEVWSDSASEVVTEYMEDQTITTINVPFVGDKKVLKFNVTDSYLGFHYVRFWVNATVDGTPKMVVGDAWFDEKLYRINAKPVFDENSSMFKVFGSDENIELAVHVQDISGNDISTASIELESLRYSMTGENIPVTDSSSSFTTDSDGDVTLEIDPEDSLKSGFYNVRIKMTTQDGVVDYGNGWFEVSNFIFYPYSTSWDAGINQPINFTLNAFDSSFGDKEVNVTLTKIIAMGDWDMMTPPTMYNDTDVEIGTINGSGYYEHPGLPRGGNFEFVFEATDGNSTEVGRAWVHTTAFVAWVDSNWEYEFPTNGFINFTVKASDDQMWGSSSHNLTDVTVEKVMQEGMWMSSYKTKTQMANITTTEAGLNPNEIDVSIDTTGWGQGAYMMTLKAVDDEGSEVFTDFWFRLELASVSITNPMRITVNAAQYYTNATSINATSDILTKQEQLESLGNVTAGKISGSIIGGDSITPLQTSYEIMGGDSWNHSFVPAYSMAVIDSIYDTIYIEYEDQEGGWPIGNLSNTTTTQVFNMSIGSEFTDYTGRTWEITTIRSDGTIGLEGKNTLKNGLLLNDTIMAMSKSGKFLMSNFHDEEWQSIDLDGDGEYYDDNYIILLADTTTAGKYDKVLISNSYNFSAGYIDASAGEPIQFGGDPIYLLSSKYQSSAYTLEFSTYNEGWNGMHIGTFQNGSVMKIPFLVTTPSGDPLSGKEVRIDYLIDEAKDKQILDNISATTDSGGLALIEIDTAAANIPTGSWMIHYNVTIGDEYAVANEEMFWELTRFEIRNFVVAGALGIPGQIDLIELSDSNSEDGIPGNNMLLAYGEELEFTKGIAAYNYGPGDVYNLNWPFNNWYYNSTTGAFNYSEDWGFTLEPGDVGVGATINTSGANVAMGYNVTSINNAGDTIVLNLGESTAFYEDMWNFTLTESSGGTATLSMSYVGWPWTLPGDEWGPGPEIQSFTEGQMYWMGGLDFEVNNITNTSAEVTLRYPLIVASVDAAGSLMDDDLENGEISTYFGSVAQVTFNDQDYYIIGYEDQAGTMYDQMEQAYTETKDSILVVNASNSSDANTYRIGETIDGFNGYYAASVANWGGKFVLLNGSATQVYPIPEWIADEPVFYTGKFSDEDIGMDLATAGREFDDDETPGIGVIDTDDRYHILLIDRLANGVNMPTEAIYDDDEDLTTLRDWENYMDLNSIYDMYTEEQGYGDAIPDFFGESIVTINMSEGQAWDIGTGNMESWPLAFPTLNIDEGENTATLKSFAPVFEVDVNESITIYITAREFDGTAINGTAELDSLKMMFGGTFMEGPTDDLPVTWDMSSAMVNTTLVNGEGALEIAPEDMSGIDYDFGEFTAFVTVQKDSGGTETLKMNFFRVNEEMMDMFEDEGPMGSEGPMGGEDDMGGDYL